MANKGQWRNQTQATNTKNKKKKKPEQDRFGKKGQSQSRQKNAEKTGSNKLKKTGNSRADERREGSVRAQKNPVNVMRSGAQNYIIKDKAQGVATTPTKAVSGAIKNAQNGVVRTAGGGNTRSNERLTNTTQKKRYEANVKKEQERRKQIEETKKKNEKNGYKYGNGIVKTLDKYSKTVDKKFEESKKKDLDYGASVLSDKKVDIPVYSKYAKGKAEKEAKAALKEGGVTQANGKKNVDNWIAKTEKDWKSQGYDVKDDVVVTEDGKTWGDIKKEAYDQEAARIRFERSKYIHQSADNAGKMSAQDLYKGGVEMASEFIDYGVPYMATAKGSIKVAEKILAKAAKAGKAGKVGAKTVPKIEHAVEDLVKNGTLSPKAAAKLNRKIALKSGAKSFSTEFVANALQDATIGTALDLGKGVSQGLQGEELQKYMKDNAIANLALGLPMSGIAGKAGAKEAKIAMSMDYAKAINDAVNITKPEAIKLENLLKKQEKGTITGAETETLKKLQEKALGEGQAVVNSKGKIEANKTSFAADDLTREEATEYFKLKAQTERGSIDSRDIPRFNELRNKVESAYRAAEVNAERTINVSGRKVTSAMQENAESAVRFYERTGDTAKLKQAQSVLEKAQKATVAKNEALATNLDKMNDITKGNYRWVDSAEMEKLSGDGKLGGYYDTETKEIVVNRDSPQAYQTVVGHETMHMLKEANREGYDKLANMLKDYVKELGDGQYESLVAEVKRAYPEEVARGDVDALDEELVSEMLGRYVFGEDDAFIKKLAGEEPTVLQKIIAYIKQFIANTNNKELADQFAKMEKTALDEIKKVKEADWKERGLKEVTGKEKADIIKKSQFTDAPVSSKDGFYSYAYEAAMQLGKNVKSRPESLLRYLKKKGVTAEELKWTGLNDFLTGKQAISKQELLDFIDANNYELYTVVRASNEYKSALGKKYNESTREELQNILKKDRDLLEDISETLGIEERTILEQPREALRAYGLNPNDMVEPPTIPERTQWDRYALDGGTNYREYEYVDPRLTGYSNQAMDVHWDGDKDVVVHSRIQDFTTGNTEPKYLDQYDLNIEDVSMVGDAVNDGVRILDDSSTDNSHITLSMIEDRVGIPIEIELRKSYDKYSADIVSTKTGEVYSELENVPREEIAYDVGEELFALGRDKKIVGDWNTSGNDKVLHIEEIQSDWHNAGQKHGYAQNQGRVGELEKQYDDLDKEYERAKDESDKATNEMYAAFETDPTYRELVNKLNTLNAKIEDLEYKKWDNEWGFSREDYLTLESLKKERKRVRQERKTIRDELSNKYQDLYVRHGELLGKANDLRERRDKLADEISNYYDRPPEAPYKNNYTDYAMKRALREAVENDYDVISWTTAKQQANRWSDEYMEGYRIEYDQDIPSFMKKYVAQWGGKVEKLKLAENGEEVWGVRITDEMRDSIKTKGQKRWSRFGIKGATEEQRKLGIEAEKMFENGKTPEEIWNKTGVIVDSDGKAKWEFSDKDMKFKFKMKDLKGENRLEDGRLEDLLEHEELFKRYPQLKDVQVEFANKSDLDGALGEYLAFGDFKLLRLAKGQSKEEMMDSIIHEIQHAIQEEEGFAGGASTEYYEKVWKNMTDEINKYKRDLPNGIDTDDYGAIDLIRMDDGEEVAAKYERLLDARNELRGEFKGYGFRGNKAADSLVESGKIPYKNTKGEWEARQTEKRRKMSQEELDATPREENKHEIKREDYDEYYSSDIKASKFSKEVKTAKEKKASTDKAIAELDEKFNGKLSAERRKQLEERRRTLEKQREEERRELNKLNRPLYEERLKEAEEKLAKLEAQRKRTKGKEKLKELDNQIRATKGKITRNKNLIANEPKKYVSDTPVKELEDSKLKYEYHDLQEKLRDETWQDILERDAIEERIEAIRKEADKRGVEVRDTLELADEVIKEKRFGWQDAKKLSNEIKDLNKKIKGIRNNEKWTKANREKKGRKVGELAKEVKAKEKRLYQIVENSKSVVPEGKTAKETFNEVVGGNTLKEKGSGKKLNKMSAKKLIEENGGAGGALRDVGKMIRRKGESSLIEYESSAKALIKNGNKELGQALLDQVNNVIVYKNKAAAAIESHRANAGGTKVGESLNDVFKVKDKNGKIVDLLLEENTEMRQDLSNYLFAKHSFAREEQGKKVFGVIGEDGKPKWTNASTQEFMDEIIRDYGRETVESFERGVRDFINYLNEYRLDTGLISKELLDKLNDIYPYYIPTNRAVLNKPPTEYELPKSTAEVENGIKRAVGGDAPLEDLYTQLAKMTMATIRSGEQNKLLSMYAKAHDIEATRLPKDATADDVLESSVEAFNSDHKGNWKVRFYQNGEAVTIPVNKHAAKGLREFNGQDYATLMEVSVKAGQLFHLREYKGFITDWNVVFGVRNGMRDAQQALVNSKDTMWYSRSIPRAVSAVANENNAFRILYDANGGRYSTLQQINRLDEIGALNKNKSTVAKGLEKIEDFNGAIEMMPRMCEFIGTIQKEAERLLGKDGVDNLMREIEAQAKIKPEAERTAWIESEYAQRVVDLIKKKKPDIIATAIRNSSDITVNFSRHGVITRALNAGFVPYLNPSVQGLSKMARMFTESKAEGLGKLACFCAKLSVLTIAPSMANEILCQGNEAYQSLNSRDKDNAFFIPMSLFGGEKDKFIKIPKPRENAVLAEPFEYGLRYFLDKAQYGTLDEFKQMFESANTNIGIVNVWEDNIFSPIINTAMNKTWYGGDILSKQELENIDNEEAWKNYDETTSLFAKKIGKTMNWSPKKVDNIMDSYLGLIYDFGISQTSQKNINDVYSSPKNFLKNNPIAQQFTKDAVFSNKYATKFWGKVDELNEGHKGDKDTIEKREYMAKYGYDTFTYDTAISNIDNDKNIPKTEKVEMKRELRKYKNQLLNRALKGEDVKYDPMQRIINLYKAHGVKNATDVCLSQYAEGDHAEAYKHLKQSKEYRDATPAEQREWQQKFLKTYKGVKRIARFTGDSDNFVNYSTVEYVCVKNGYTKGHIANMYAWKSKEYAVEKGLQDMQKYIDAGYTEKNFKITMRAMNRGADALGDPDKQYASQLDDYDKAMICAKNGYRDGAYLIASPYIGKARMNAGRCLVEGHSGEDYKWTDKRINKFCKKYDITADKNHKWDLEQVADAVRKEYGDKTPEEQAAVYTVITGDTENNPFGEIGDYSHKNDSGLLEDEDKKGKGGRGRRRGRRGGGGGGGSGKGKVPSTDTGAISGKVTDPFSTTNGSKSSNLNDAYRKKVRKLRSQLNK